MARKLRIVKVWLGGRHSYHFDMDTNIGKLGLDADPVVHSISVMLNMELSGEDEANGGYINYLKIGLKYDSRDQQALRPKAFGQKQ